MLRSTRPATASHASSTLADPQQPKSSRDLFGMRHQRQVTCIQLHGGRIHASCQKSRLITASTAFPTSNVRSASRQPSSCRLSPGRTSAVMAVKIRTNGRSTTRRSVQTSLPRLTGSSTRSAEFREQTPEMARSTSRRLANGWPKSGSYARSMGVGKSAITRSASSCQKLHLAKTACGPASRCVKRWRKWRPQMSPMVSEWESSTLAKRARGVHWRGEGGDQERELAARYRNWAQKLGPEYPFVGSVRWSH